MRNKKIPDEIVYNVTVERKPNPWHEMKYKTNVEVFINGTRNWDFSETFYTYTQKGGKKKALKHILRQDKNLLDKKAFGIIFETKGFSTEVKEKLSE